MQRRGTRSCSCICLLLILAVIHTERVDAASPLSFVRFTRKPALGQMPLDLTEESGPWMIFAASFAGDGAERDASELVQELRKRFKMKAYVHGKHYDFSQPVQGLGLDRFGTPKQMRFSTEAVFDEVAVLVGDYPSADDPKLQKHLNLLKYAHPDCLAIEKNKDTTLRFAGLRELHKRLTGDQDKKRKGPMGKAFATRNPMLPREAFAPGGLDELVLSMNKGGKYSLLDCPGKYTVKVATYRGQVIIDQREVQAIESGKKMDSRLDDAGEKAEKLVNLLRKRRVEAYVFHDRHESIVTVGSFESVGNQRANGQIELNPAIAKVIEAYGPARKPLQGKDGSSLAGIQPKTLGGLMFDVAPKPVIVPRRSIGADYVTSR